MKKTMVLLVAGLLVLGLSGCTIDGEQGGNTSTDTSGDTSTVSAQGKTESKKDMDISIVSAKVGADYKDAPILLVEYEFTNNTDNAKSFTFLCQDTAFQNGVECSSTVISDAVDAQQQLNDVKPGTPYKLTVGYQLQDTETDVEIEITDLFGTETFLTQTVTLK